MNDKNSKLQTAKDTLSEESRYFGKTQDECPWPRYSVSGMHERRLQYQVPTTNWFSFLVTNPTKRIHCSFAINRKNMKLHIGSQKFVS
jgi:hypothetical protein